MKTKPKTPVYREPVGRIGVQMVVFTIILGMVIAMLVWNTSNLRTHIESTAHRYVEDVASQLTNDISGRILANLRMMEQLADSVQRLSDRASAEEFLKRKAEIIEFDQLFLVMQEQTVPEAVLIENPQQVAGIQESFSGRSRVTYIPGQCLLFSVPIYQEGAVTMVLAGIRDQRNMQALIAPHSFGGEGLTCIVNQQGEVVILPTDVAPFQRLDEVFSQGDSAAAGAIQAMQQDWQDGRAGSFHFTAVDGTHLILSYCALGINDWVLLILIPDALIMGEVDLYTFRAFLIVGGVIAVFVLLYGIVFQFYQKNRRSLEKIAFVDPLTGGMNRAAFQMACDERIAASPAGRYTVALLNIRGFKLINENFGIAVGDEILRAIYQVLSDAVTNEELVARDEADAFFLLLEDERPEHLRARLDAMVQRINEFGSRMCNGYRIHLRQGACVADGTETDTAVILEHARIAAQYAVAPDQCTFYSAELIDELKKEQELNALLDPSLKNGDFQVYLQPKIRLTDDRLCGAEALVRWVHPQRGMIYPSDFIPVFEKSDAICRLDLYVFEKVCALLQQWQAEGKPLLPISVNLSRMHFRNVDFLRQFAAIKQQYGVPDGLLELELTESIFFNEQQRELTKEIICQMHSFGFRSSLDDFGVGFSSLVLLQEFNVDTIKLDRAFFDDLEQEKAQKIISHLIALSKDLGIGVVAEGIETERQLAILRTLHCDMVQGYIFSKPLSIAEFETWRNQ